MIKRQTSKNKNNKNVWKWYNTWCLVKKMFYNSFKFSQFLAIFFFQIKRDLHSELNIELIGHLWMRFPSKHFCRKESKHYTVQKQINSKKSFQTWLFFCPETVPKIIKRLLRDFAVCDLFQMRIRGGRGKGAISPASKNIKAQKYKGRRQPHTFHTFWTLPSHHWISYYNT